MRMRWAGWTDWLDNMCAWACSLSRVKESYAQMNIFSPQIISFTQSCTHSTAVRSSDRMQNPNARAMKSFDIYTASTTHSPKNKSPLFLVMHYIVIVVSIRMQTSAARLFVYFVFFRNFFFCFVSFFLFIFVMLVCICLCCLPSHAWTKNTLFNGLILASSLYNLFLFHPQYSLTCRRKCRFSSAIRILLKCFVFSLLMW